MSAFRDLGDGDPSRVPTLSPPDASGEMQEFLSTVVKASKLPAKQRGMNVKPAVDQLASLAYDQGLLPTDLIELVKLVTTPSYLDQASIASIIRNLYPATSVDGDLVIKIIGCLGHGKLKPSLTIQAALLKWLIMIQNIVENRNCFLRAYPVLFNLLDTATLRTYVCHLLALITRRRHVRPHRIQALLLLSRQTGNDPALTGLLRVYKDYYPEIIVGDVTRGKALAFNHPDSQWRERLDEIQRAHAQRRTSRSEKPLDAFRVARHRMNGNKNFPIPEVHTSHATERSVTLEEIESVDGFVKTIERIELPNQLISILGDPLLQKLLGLRPQAQAHLRACNWFRSYAQDMMTGESDTRLADILATLKNYVTATKALPPIFLAFLAELLNEWDGVDGREVILDILTYTPLADFQANHMPTHNHVLDFYYETASLSSDAHLLTHAQVPTVPPAILVYSMFFAASPLTASRMCSVVAKYKEGFQIALSVAQINYTPRHITEFNSFLMDICNCLWRQRALSGDDANAKGCMVPQLLAEDLSNYVTSLSIGAPLASLFSLSYSPNFGSFAISFLRGLEEEVEEQDTLGIKHAGPVTKTSLKALANKGGINVSWDDYRRGVLGYLASHDMGGVDHLLFLLDKPHEGTAEWLRAYSKRSSLILQAFIYLD
ncbi:hypothetical protein NPX13_g10067 [Xylaria arbuscula]|uniref:Mis6 domain protein n=1 Tax=Xylaria arbuscula TaxID=114810 RepID=A0A9W8N5J0_9PEZI|nr:hypothetical protein NPX13_g10067 [Xylaria arbuscula]